ncbi:hypothetical protein EUA79_01225 [TM7 phylum sp. oral taxon 351]|nr:hypothetical protein EUA79_01225 [TM7 phylum sp. oral taxon 351]
MDTKHENLSNNESNEGLDPKIQALADMAGKMGELGRKPDEYNEFGFDRNGVHKNGTRFDNDGYNIWGRDRFGFDRNGICIYNKKEYDLSGYNQEGYNSEGYDREGFGRDGFSINGFNREGIHRNGTQFDEEGYGADGFDEDGIDREGFDREGLGSDGRDRKGFDQNGYNQAGYDREGYNQEGYNREGLDKNGFNKNGIHYLTNRKYDLRGHDRDGYNINGYNSDGYDREGYDRQGYDKNGFDRGGFFIDGFNREGINKYTATEYDARGWSQYGKKHQETGTGYDPEGYDANGFDESGRDRGGYDYQGFNSEGYNKRGFDKSGIHRKTNTKYDEEGYDSRGIDSYGFDRSGGRRHPDGSPMFYTNRKNGYDVWGVDKDGYKEDGFNRFGFDREGYDREGLDKDGYTREYNAKFNKFGLDENGYMKNGEIDPDVEFAINFSESGIKELTKYAAEKGMEYKEVQDRIESARKKFPAIDETITNIFLTGNKMRLAAISNDCEKFINGELDVKEFWDKHPRLNISGILFNFINDPEKRKQFSDRTVENLVLDSDSIEENLRIFGTSQYDVPGALKGIEDFKKTYVRFGVDGSPEQIQKKRENTKKIFDTMKYLSKYKNQNLNSLLGSRQSFDGGQTWTDFNGELIGHAMDALKADKKLICVQSVKDYIVKQIKNSSQNKTQ